VLIACSRETNETKVRCVQVSIRGTRRQHGRSRSMEQIWHDSGAFFALIAASGALAGTSILERRARTLRLSSILATILVLVSGLAFTQSTAVAFALGLPAIGFLVMASARHVQSYVERVASFAVQSRTLHACVILIGGPLLAWGLATHAD